MNQALYIGRFQPFHLGHLDAIKQIFASGTDRVIIGIGSAEDNFKPDNPFTASERFQMIEACLQAENIKNFVIIPVRNINNYDLWPSHVEMLVPPFNEIFTGSPIVRELFEKQGKHPVYEIVRNLDICSTDVRSIMLNKGNWEKSVHPAVAKLLKKWNACKRLEDIKKY